MEWNFKRESGFENPTPGKHRVRIKSAEMAVSKSGRDMMFIQLEVSNYSTIIRHYIVFMQDNPEMTNRMLTQFFDSFAIEEGDFNVAGYAGKVGGAMLKEDGEYIKVHYFLGKEAISKLEPWDSKKNAKPVTTGTLDISGESLNLSDFEEIPF